MALLLLLLSVTVTNNSHNLQYNFQLHIFHVSGTSISPLAVSHNIFIDYFTFHPNQDYHKGISFRGLEIQKVENFA